MQEIKIVFKNALKEKEDIKPSFIQKIVFKLSEDKLALHKNLDKNIQEIFKEFLLILNELNLDNEDNISALMQGLIKASINKKELDFYALIHEQNALKERILNKKEELKNDIHESFLSIEQQILVNELNENDKLNKILKDTKLKGIEFLGVLREITEDAFLRVIEKGDDIKDLIQEISKNLVFQAISEGNFTKQRFIDIVQTVLNVSIELADSSQAIAKDLLQGSIYGSREGAIKAVERLKNDLKYAPEEVVSKDDLINLRKVLSNIDEDLIFVIKKQSSNSQGISAKIINDIVKLELDSLLARLKRSIVDTKNALSIRIEEIKESENIKQASRKFDDFKTDILKDMEALSKKMEILSKNQKDKFSNAEAKKLGERAWEVAKDFIKNAKDAIKNEK